MRLRRPSPATMISCVALAVALGGTATAARTLIQSKDIAPGAVKARNLAKGAVTKAKLAPGVAIAGPQGPQGPRGLAGPKGDTGLAPGSVGSAELQDGAVTAAKIATGAISQASQVADGSLALTALRGTAWGDSTDWGTVPAHLCLPVILNEGAGSPIRVGDLLLPGVSPQLPAGIFVAPTVAPADGMAAILLCNSTASPIPVGSPTWVQINYKIVR